MNILFLIATALVNQQPSSPNLVRIERATPGFLAALESSDAPWGPAIRAQNPTYDDNPVTPGGSVPQTYSPPSSPNQVFSQAPSNGTYDPFLNGGSPPPGVGDPYGAGQYSYGIYGPQPYRMGWSSEFEGGYIFAENTKAAGGGSFSVVESHVGLRYTTAGPNGWIWGWTNSADIRNWTGPSLVGLPGSAYRLASDLELTSPEAGGFSIRGGFTPQIATDFQKSLNSDAYMFDARVLMFYRLSPEWMLVGGVQYWDRVQDLFIPTGGVIWTPGDLWEFRLMYPKAMASVFLGNMLGLDTKFYASGEYHVESYALSLGAPLGRDQIQLSDYRIMLGLRGEAGGFTSFVEGGIVLDRDVIFAGNAPDFRLGDGYIIRAGLQF